jgi:hypothetical protein
MYRACTLRRKTCLGVVHVDRPVPASAAVEGAIILADGAAWMVVRVGDPQILVHNDLVGATEILSLPDADLSLCLPA